MEPTLHETAVMAVAIGVVSLTITQATIFEWLREWIADRSEFLGELFECPYCMSHWIALLVMLIYRPQLLSTGHLWPDLVVSWFALVGLGSLVSGILLRVFGSSE
jgi:hypothetical protein